MASEVYSVVSLVMRYWFIALGILVVVQAFVWLLRERNDRHRRIRNLPDAGMIGEFVVLRGNDVMEEGMTLPIPWEGMLGSDQACDVMVMGEGIAPVHLFFSFDRRAGLRLEMARGQTCYVDGEQQIYRLFQKRARMRHGSILEFPDCVLRFRIFAGLDIEKQPGVREQDEAMYGMPVASQGVPRRGYRGWKDPQTEAERYTGLHLVKDQDASQSQESLRDKHTKGKDKKKKS